MVMTERRKALLQRTFLDYMPHSAFEANPLVVERAEGLYYWDVTGKVAPRTHTELMERRGLYYDLTEMQGR